ncbi:single-stranded DNA-binding protein [Saezia sanguinis]|uniref:single-stranded DNA-binding protein n=1 Tax=Saezia sanguinis TaxID=1965230 RepID=UPI0030345DF4
MPLNENLHFIEGTLGRDPEVSYTTGGTAICNVTVATSYWDSQKKEEVTEWVRAKIIGKQAEYIGEYARKGSEVKLKGRVQTRKWQDKNGEDRYTTETVCFDAQIPRLQRSEGQLPRPAQSGLNSYAAAKSGSARPNMAGKGDAWEAGAQDPDLDDVPF